MLGSTKQHCDSMRVYHDSRKSSRIMTLALFLVITTMAIVPSSSYTTTRRTMTSTTPCTTRLGKTNHPHPHRSSSTTLWMASTASASSSARLSSVAPLQYIHHDEEAERNAVSTQDLAVTLPNHAPQEEETPGLPVIRAIAVSQLMTLGLTTLVTCGLLVATQGNPDPLTWHWNYDSMTYHSLFEFVSSGVSYESVLWGIGATIPMIYMGTLIEQSHERDESHVNFSTMNMVMTLFGRRPPPSQPLQDPPPHNKGMKTYVLPTPPTTTTATTTSSSSSSSSSMMQVLPVAAGIALMTGLSEELVFRGEIPTVLNQWLSSTSTWSSSSSSSMDTWAIFLTVWVAQATLFGLGHVSSKASWGENRIVSGLQFINGLWYGVVYTMTGGNILPCMIAHCLYDCHVFMETWMSMNDQMDYTDQACSQTLSLHDKNAIAQIKKEAGPNLTSQTLDYTRRFFYTFDYEHKGSLSRADVQRAVSYAFLQDDVQPSPQRVNKLFEGMLKRRAKESYRPKGDIISSPEDFPQDRLRLSDFLRVLFVLKGNPT